MIEPTYDELEQQYHMLEQDEGLKFNWDQFLGENPILRH